MIGAKDLFSRKYTFWSYDPRGKFSLSAKADKLKRYKSLMGFAIYATFHSRAICLRRDMCLRHVSALRAQGRWDLYSRTFHHVRHQRTYRYRASRDNIAFAEQIYRAPKVHIAFAKRTKIGQMMILSKTRKLVLQQYGVTYRKE